MESNFGPYVIDELVAEGSVATVWRATHSELGRHVAIKALTKVGTDSSTLGRFRTEARRQTELDDPHIVAVYDFVDHEETPYLVTEWVEGQTLREMMTRVGTLTPEQSLGVLRGALQGLAYAHQRGLVHGDVSPSNLMVDRSGTTKLIDFGLAAPAGEPGVSGTPAYLSPEAAGGLPLTPASDVYSAGAVLFELLDGHPVFPGPDAVTVIRAHRDETAPELTDHGPQLAALLRRALAKDPTDRPSDAGVLLSELETAAAERYGSGWLSKASVASLAGVVGASAAAGMAATVTAGGAATTAATTAAASGTATAEALATSAAVDTGLAQSTQSTAHGAAVAAHAGRGARLLHLATVHPVVTGAVAVVAVAAVTTTTVVATSSSKPKPAPEAVLLASSPQGKFVLSGTQSVTSKGKVTNSKSTPFTATITEQCTPTGCKAILLDDTGKRPFTYDGTTFVSTTKTTSRVLCPDVKTNKTTPGDSALLHQAREWRLKVSKRAAATADGPGRALELTGTETLTETASGFTGHCVDGGTLVYHFNWTARAA